MENKQNVNPQKNTIKRILLKACTFLIIISILLMFIFGIAIIKNDNMFPSIYKGDICVFTRVEPYSLEDVVIYKQNNEIHIGRIMAINGQTVDFQNEFMTIDNAIPLEQLPIKTFQAKNSSIQFPITLKQDEFFILNDNRENTEDSRQYGIINKKDIKGKVEYILRGGL